MGITKKYFTRWRIVSTVFLMVLLAQAAVPSLLPHASAGTLTSGMVRFNRMNASQATTGNLDTSNWATASVANTCGSGSQACDQIQVSATVNASFSFSLSATTAPLGTLTTSSPTASSAINASVSTNATHGWQMWAADL